MNYTRHFILLLLTWMLLAACGSATPPPPPPTPTASPAPTYLLSGITAETLPSLVVAEREAAIAHNLPLLAALWAEDGRIVDGRGSETIGDNYVWSGRAAILDRYELAVFPAPPPPLTLTELATATLTVEGVQATLIYGVDRWHFVQREGRWWLQELLYSAP